MQGDNSLVLNDLAMLAKKKVGGRNPSNKHVINNEANKMLPFASVN